MSENVRSALRFVGSLLTMMSALIILMAAISTYQYSKSFRNWPQTEAQISSADLYTMQEGPRYLRFNAYGVRWVVRFKLGDSIVDSSADPGFRSVFRGMMERMKDRFPPGTQVQVRYAPFEPGRVVIVGDSFRDTYPSAWFLFWAAGCGLVVGVGMLVTARGGAQISRRRR